MEWMEDQETECAGAQKQRGTWRGCLRPSRGRVCEGKRVHVGLFLPAGGALVFMREEDKWWDGLGRAGYAYTGA